MLEILFWSLLLLVVYSYGIYPFLLLMLSSLVQLKRDVMYVLGAGNARIGGQTESSYLPDVAVIISAFNEEDCIADRIRNLQALDYPIDRIRFYIGSDGSSDGTSEILSGIDDSRLCFRDFQENRGKASVLNDLVAEADADILVFSDANTAFEPDAIRKLCRHFENDEHVAAVCGELDLVDAESGDNLDGAYWKYERILKFNESRIGGLLGANGAIYAIRKNAYEAIPADTVVDDFMIVFRIALSGGTVRYDPEARAKEEVAPSSGDEYRRRVRIGSGNFQAFHRCLSALNPKYGALWFCYVSHKVFRWYAPGFLMLAWVISGVLGLQSTLYMSLFAAQTAVYLFSYLRKDGSVAFAPFRLLVFWVNMNIALGHGAIRYYRGGVKGSWNSTSR